MREEQRAAINRLQYPPGCRIELLEMNDPYAPIQPGTRGTVAYVDDMGTLHMHWDNGRTLGVIPGEDSFRKLTPEEVEEEQLYSEEAEDMGMTM